MDIQRALAAVASAESRLETIDPRSEEDLEEDETSQHIAEELGEVWTWLQHKDAPSEAVLTVLRHAATAHAGSDFDWELLRQQAKGALASIGVNA